MSYKQNRTREACFRGRSAAKTRSRKIPSRAPKMTHPARSLGPCNECDTGRFKTYKTKTIGAVRILYLRCDLCGTNGQEVAGVDDLGRTIFRVDTRSSIYNPLNASGTAYNSLNPSGQPNTPEAL